MPADPIAAARIDRRHPARDQPFRRPLLGDELPHSPVRRAFADGVAITLAATLTTAPVLACHFESVPLAGNRATALALVFSELLQNALEHGGGSVRVELARRNGDVVLAIADDGGGIDSDPAQGTGLSIVRALVRDELRGTLSLASEGGLRAEVIFPA